MEWLKASILLPLISHITTILPQPKGVTIVRILHTADWHLGKTVNEVPMIEDQRHYLHSLIDEVKGKGIDAVIMAGDLYDRSLPPKEAVTLANEILTRMIRELGVPVLAIAGNHDSNERVEYGSQLLSLSGLYIEGTVKPIPRKIRIGDANFFLAPFGDPLHVRHVLQNKDIHDMEDVARAQVALMKEDMDMAELNVLIAHGYVVNGLDGMEARSDSERPLTIGTAEHVPVELLDCFDYVALGHLHMAQKVRSERVRYSGSILKYSKSECRHKKQASIVTLEKDRLEVEPIYIEPLHDMRTVRGSFQELLQSHSDDYLFFELEDTGVIMDPMNRLRQKYPHAMGLEYVGHVRENRTAFQTNPDDLRKVSLPDLFKDFYQHYLEKDLNEKQMQIVMDTYRKVEESSR